MKTIIVTGAPGAGKGYLCDVLVEKAIALGLKTSDIAIISTGDLIRAEIAKQTELGKKCQESHSSGGYVTDALVFELLQNNSENLKNKTLVLFDGFPRTMAQAKFFKSDKELLVIYRNTPDDIILERVRNRRVCAKCKHTHLASDSNCPKCGGESIIRKDDALIEQRLEIYKEETLPVIDNLKKRFAFFEIDGAMEFKTVASGLIKKVL